MLTAAGFSHPRPLAAVETCSLGAIRTSFLLSEPLHGAHVLSRFALGDRRNFRRRKWISQRLAGEIQRLHEAGLYTLDLQETNLLLTADGDDITVYFVDLEDIRRARAVSERRRLLNLVHLDRSIGRFIPRTQRLRFLYNYLGGRPERDEARRLLRILHRMRARQERRKQLQRGRNGAAARPAEQHTAHGQPGAGAKLSGAGAGANLAMRARGH
jgi:hypothetical protein